MITAALLCNSTFNDCYFKTKALSLVCMIPINFKPGSRLGEILNLLSTIDQFLCFFDTLHKMMWQFHSLCDNVQN